MTEEESDVLGSEQLRSTFRVRKVIRESGPKEEETPISSAQWVECIIWGRQAGGNGGRSIVGEGKLVKGGRNEKPTIGGKAELGKTSKYPNIPKGE